MSQLIKKASIPKFANEAEEAEWWYKRRERLGDDAEAALARGELKPRRLPPSPVIKHPFQKASGARSRKPSESGRSTSMAGKSR